MSSPGRTRACTLAFLMLVALALPAVPARAWSGSFVDDDGSPHESSIEAIAAVGITRGCDEHEFCPAASVTRGQMAAFMVRALGLRAGAGSDRFSDDDGSVFESDIERLAHAGITSGCTPTRFCPDRAVTRGQMAAFIVRATGLRAGAGSDRFSDDDDSVFESDIERLAHAGITRGCSATRFCPTQPVTRAQMATFLTRALDLVAVQQVPPALPPEPHETLVDSFHVMRDDDGELQAYWRNMAYLPRSFDVGVDVDGTPGSEAWQVDLVEDPGAYRGWDVLSPPDRSDLEELARDDDWLRFQLNRPATIGVVWRDEAPLPSWLRSGWRTGGTVDIDGDEWRVHERSFRAGPVRLGTVEGSTRDSRDMYTVLLAEADGTPTAAPPVPSGRTRPTVGEPCPAWVHGRHTTTGPDGRTYESWHPQWDPVHWCSFGHDHGTTPAVIPGAPMVPYGYVASHLGQDEPNAGFKEFTFQDLDQEHWVRFVVHAGTSSVRRVCARHHTLYVQVYDRAGTELMDVGFKADYGAAEATSDAGRGTLTPTTCGYSMTALASLVDDERTRRINVGSASDNYETWRSRENTTQVRNLGMAVFEHSFDIRNPMSHCVDRTCDRVALRDPSRENGTRRTIDMGRREGFTFSPATAPLTGTFHTDPYGDGPRRAGGDGLVEQFIDPAVANVDFFPREGVRRIECTANDAWTMLYRCYQLRDGEKLPSPADTSLMGAIVRN